MNLRTLLFLARKDLLKDLRVLLFVLPRRLNVERRQTIALVAHEEEWGARADRVIRLRDGQV